MKVLIALSVVTGLVFLSFFGAAAMSHGGAHAGGCLASDLLLAVCPEGLGSLASALFHSALFLSLFQLVLTPAALLLVLLVLIKVRSSLAPTGLISWPIERADLGFLSLLRLKRWLSLREHSPTA